MQRCNSEDFREKEVVNVCDGKKLGCVGEIEFNVCDGKLTAIIVPLETGFFGTGKERIVIPWDKIVCIGEDVILVNGEGICPVSDGKKKGGKK